MVLNQIKLKEEKTFKDLIINKASILAAIFHNIGKIKKRKENVEKYIEWNDWKVLGLINAGGVDELNKYDAIISKIHNKINEDDFF